MNANRPTATCIAFALAACGLLATVLTVRVVRPVSVQVTDPVLAALNARHARLRGFDRAALEASETERHAAEASLWDRARTDVFCAELRRLGFVLQPLDRAGDHDLVLVRFLVTHPDYPYRDWEQLVDLVHRLAGSPALTIDSLTLEPGSGNRPAFAKVQFVLALATQPADR